MTVQGLAGRGIVTREELDQVGRDPQATQKLEIRIDGTTHTLEKPDCEGAAVVARARKRAQPLGSDLDRYHDALESYAFVEEVNRTAPGSLRFPFLGYVSVLHHEIHPVFSDQYLENLDNPPKPQRLRMDLDVTIELVVDAKGELVRMGVVESSGVPTFDANALHSIATAAPFPPPPPSVLSEDGHFYVHWQLHRNPRYGCSTYFAHPFVLSP